MYRKMLLELGLVAVNEAMSIRAILEHINGTKNSMEK